MNLPNGSVGFDSVNAELRRIRTRAFCDAVCGFLQRHESDGRIGREQRARENANLATACDRLYDFLTIEVDEHEALMARIVAWQADQPKPALPSPMQPKPLIEQLEDAKNLLQEQHEMLAQAQNLEDAADIIPASLQGLLRFSVLPLREAVRQQERYVAHLQHQVETEMFPDGMPSLEGSAGVIPSGPVEVFHRLPDWTDLENAAREHEPAAAGEEHPEPPQDDNQARPADGKFPVPELGDAADYQENRTADTKE